MNHPRKGIIWTSLAGPLSNLLAALVGGGLMQIVFPFYYADPNAVLTGIYTLLYWFVAINISLAVFNLIPVPPLDGSRIFNLLLPKKWYFAVMRYERIILLALFAVLFLGLLDVPLNWLYTAAGRLLDFSTGYVELALRALLH